MDYELNYELRYFLGNLIDWVGNFGGFGSFCLLGWFLLPLERDCCCH